jgi:hypothetical protein
MWIRSQDKTELIDVRGKRLTIWTDSKSSWCIWIDFIIPGSELFKIGKYSSKERALEILNEIQTHISYQGMYSFQDKAINLSKDDFVYQMPEK